MMNKRIFATLVAMGMVASMGTMTANAASITTSEAVEATASGTGDVEDVIDMEIVTAVLPTSIGSAFNFKVDPQELMEKAGAGSLGASLSLTPSKDNTVLFTNSGSTYSNKSDVLTITAYNSVNADISVKATVGTADSKIKFSSTNDFGATINTNTGTDDEKAAAVKQKAADEAAHLYLAMETVLNEQGESSAVNATTAFTDKGLDFTASDLNALNNSTEFEVKYTTGAPGTYSYSHKSSGTEKNELKFNLVGSSNPDADWTGMADESLALNFVWSVKKHVEKHLSADTITASASTLDISGGVTVTSAMFSFGGATADLAGTGLVDLATPGKVKFSADFFPTYVGGSVIITFSDGATETVTIA